MVVSSYEIKEGTGSVGERGGNGGVVVVGDDIKESGGGGKRLSSALRLMREQWRWRRRC